MLCIIYIMSSVNPLLLLPDFESELAELGINFYMSEDTMKDSALAVGNEDGFLEKYALEVYTICRRENLKNQKIYDELLRVVSNIKNGSSFICSYEIDNVDQTIISKYLYHILAPIIDFLCMQKTSKTIQRPFDVNDIESNRCWMVSLLVPVFSGDAQPFSEWDESIIFFYLLKIYTELTKVGFVYRDENYY